jgi:regulator of ribosome biosynthesis
VGLQGQEQGHRGAVDPRNQEWRRQVASRPEPSHPDPGYLADPNFDPVKAAKSERKGRKLKNEGQQLKNIERATQASLRAGSSKASAPALPAGLAALESKDATATGAQASKKADIARLLKATRTSTASLGRFDKTLDKEVAVIGKDAARGQKRKFEPNEVSASDEREGALKMLKTLGHASGGKGKRVGGDEPVVNVRKAIKEVTKGHGVTSMDRGRGRGRGGGRGGATRGSSSSRGSSRGGSSRGGSSRGGGSRGGGRGGKR